MKIVRTFKVKYIDPLSQEKESEVIANSKKDALSFLNIPPASVISTSSSIKLKSQVSLTVQLQLLTRVIGGILSGEQLPNYFPSIIDDFHEFARFKPVIDGELKKSKPLSELLTVLPIDELCIKIIANGERAGKVKESVKSAQDFLKLRKKIDAGSKSGLKSQIFLAFVALLTLFWLPAWIVDFYVSMESSGLSIDKTLSTHILFFIDAHRAKMIVALVASIIASFVFRTQLTNSLSKLYPFSLFYGLKATNDSILFLSIFTPLFRSGIPVGEFTNAYKSVNHANAKKLNTILAKGVSIDDAVQGLQFSNSFKTGMRGFSKMGDAESKTNLLEDLFDSLTDELIIFAERTGLLVKMAANILMYIVILLATFGFLLPQLTIGVS